MGSPISLLPVKDFTSCDHYSGLQTLSAINNTPISIHGTKHLQVQLPTGVIHSYPWTFKVANVEMAILGCDFLAFHGLQLDFTEMLLVDPHVIGLHNECVIQGSRLNKAKERFPPQPSINEVDNLSITRNINLLPAVKTATTDIGVGSVGQANTNIQYGITSQQINTCEQGDVTCKQDVRVCEQAHTELPVASDSSVITTACNPASDVRVEAKPSLSNFPQPPSNHLLALCNIPQPLQSCTVNATTSAPIDTIVKNDVLWDEIFSAYPGAFEPTPNLQPVCCNIEHHVITSGLPVVSRVCRLSPERLAFVK